MPALKCLIIEDEPLQVKKLEKFIQQTPELILVGTYEKIPPLVERLESEVIDLIFLDIRLHGDDNAGLNFLDQYAGMNFLREVIITSGTTNIEVPFSAIEYNANYLRKPFSYKKFQEIIERVLNNIYQEEIARESPLIKGRENYILVKNNEKRDSAIERLNFDEILYIQSSNDGNSNTPKITIYTDASPKRKVLTHSSLTDFEEHLPVNLFRRINRSTIIHFDKIQTVHIAGHYLYLKGGGHFLSIGNTYKNNLREYYENR